MRRNRNNQSKPDSEPAYFGPDLLGELATITKAVMGSIGYMYWNNQPYPCYCYGSYIRAGTLVRVVGNNKGHGYAVVVDTTADTFFPNSGEPFAA
jgi:hypothetical protein